MDCRNLNSVLDAFLKIVVIKLAFKIEIYY